MTPSPRARLTALGVPAVIIGSVVAILLHPVLTVLASGPLRVVSDRARKEGICPVDGQQILHRVAQLPALAHMK